MLLPGTCLFQLDVFDGLYAWHVFFDSLSREKQHTMLSLFRLRILFARNQRAR
jgi:hypothetical protein